MSFFTASIAFLFISFTLNIGDLSVGLVPTFFGFFLAIQGVRTLRGDSNYITLALVTGGLGIPLAFILYIVELFRIAEGLTLAVLIIIQMILAILTIFFVISALGETEKAFGVDIAVRQLKRTLFLVVGVELASAVLLVVWPRLTLLYYSAIVLSAILLMLRFEATRGLYEAAFPRDNADNV